MREGRTEVGIEVSGHRPRSVPLFPLAEFDLRQLVLVLNRTSVPSLAINQLSAIHAAEGNPASDRYACSVVPGPREPARARLVVVDDVVGADVTVVTVRARQPRSRLSVSPEQEHSRRSQSTVLLPAPNQCRLDCGSCVVFGIVGRVIGSILTGVRHREARRRRARQFAPYDSAVAGLVVKYVVNLAATVLRQWASPQYS